MKAKLLSGKAVLVPGLQGGDCDCGGSPTCDVTPQGDCKPTGNGPSDIY